VRIYVYFSKSKGVCQQKSWGETLLGDMTCSLWCTELYFIYDKRGGIPYKFSLVLTAFIEMPELLQNMDHNYKFWKENEKSGIHRIQDVMLMQQKMKACEKTD